MVRIFSFASENLDRRKKQQMEGDKESLEKVQRTAISTISGLRSQQYEEKLRKLELCTLEERRHQLDMTHLQNF
jgi:hypothetical protein